ncbi:hypothetical protein BJ508DRAFT_37394 [Ascobolus immersus RN42]|uniref:Uncharacterized protein n=1 Tax=Ascobolus immersus RN42 TaxID=1160509 RepID=A0A3N4IJL8_ASCIM|nr:hypothetical protein BJ508DRAFT_37394 [Ascobolus immersus RN42]
MTCPRGGFKRQLPFLFHLYRQCQDGTESKRIIHKFTFDKQKKQPPPQVSWVSVALDTFFSFRWPITPGIHITRLKIFGRLVWRKQTYLIPVPSFLQQRFFLRSAPSSNHRLFCSANYSFDSAHHSEKNIPTIEHLKRQKAPDVTRFRITNFGTGTIHLEIHTSQTDPL